MFLELKLSQAELMIARYITEKQYELGTGLGKYGDGIPESIRIKGQDTTFCLGFKPMRKDFRAMVA